MIRSEKEEPNFNWFKRILDIPTEYQLKEYLSNLDLEDLIFLCSSGEINPWCEYIDDRTLLIEMIMEKVIIMKNALRQVVRKEAIDSFSSLPNELIGQILHQLQEPESISSVLPVSKKFQQIGTSVLSQIPVVVKSKNCPFQEGCITTPPREFSIQVFDDGSVALYGFLSDVKIRYIYNDVIWHCSCIPLSYYSSSLYDTPEQIRILRKSIQYQNGKTTFTLREIIELVLEFFKKPLSLNESNYLFPDSFMQDEIKAIFGVNNPVSLLNIVLYYRSQTPSAHRLVLNLTISTYGIEADLIFKLARQII